jgi:hypothetical protein
MHALPRSLLSLGRRGRLHGRAGRLETDGGVHLLAAVSWPTRGDLAIVTEMG